MVQKRAFERTILSSNPAASAARARVGDVGARRGRPIVISRVSARTVAALAVGLLLYLVGLPAAFTMAAVEASSSA